VGADGRATASRGRWCAAGGRHLRCWRRAVGARRAAAPRPRVQPAGTPAGWSRSSSAAGGRVVAPLFLLLRAAWTSLLGRAAGCSGCAAVRVLLLHSIRNAGALALACCCAGCCSCRAGLRLVAWASLPRALRSSPVWLVLSAMAVILAVHRLPALALVAIVLPQAQGGFRSRLTACGNARPIMYWPGPQDPSARVGRERWACTRRALRCCPIAAAAVR
jgi:hypothetical protein